MSVAAVLIPGALKWFASTGMGILSGLGAELMKARQDARDKKHELALLHVQLQFAEVRAKAAIADTQAAGAAGVEADLQTTDMAYQGPKPTGIRLIDFLNGVLRPLAGFAAIGAFCVFSTVLLVAMGAELRAGDITFTVALQAFQDSLIADTIIGVWGFLYGARNFKAGRSS